MDKSYETYKEILKSRLNEKRYYHSLCVADEAKRLAIKYGGDIEKCYLAGLLHDITKNTSNEEHLQIFKSFGIMLNDIEKSAQKLWHAISGEAYIKNILQMHSILQLSPSTGAIWNRFRASPVMQRTVPESIAALPLISVWNTAKQTESRPKLIV